VFEVALPLKFVMNARRRMLVNLFKVFDLSLMLLAFLAAALAVLRHSHTFTIGEFFSMRIKIQNFFIFALFIFLWCLIFSLSGLYDSHRLSNRYDEVLDVIRATSLATCVIVAGSVFFPISLITPLFVVVFWCATTFTIASSRLVLQFMLAIVRKHGRNLRNIVIIGTSERALDLARRLGSRPELGYRITGFVDQDWCGIELLQKAGYSMVGDFNSFPQFLRNNVVDEVAIALPVRSMHDQASRIAALCEAQGVTVRVMMNFFDLKIANSSIEELEGLHLITSPTGWTEGWPILAKRVFDLVTSVLLIVASSPIWLITAILIKATSPGPVFFVQKRLGLNKRPFSLYKFRTMVVDAEQRMHEVEHLNEVSGPVFKMMCDPRITPLGTILRKISIDELPQLFNVFKGDMSLVGPRPLPIRDYEGFHEDWQRRRFSVRPGITCLWQVAGRSSIPFEKWMELDLQYIDKWSLWLDLQILLRTIPAVLRGSGAA
jgi:exopolysaccharide biosynthesis polyprenyl glycosylphosphotransferase